MNKSRRSGRGTKADNNQKPVDTERANGNLSRWEKSDPDAIEKYVDAISGNWRRGVESFLEKCEEISNEG